MSSPYYQQSGGGTWGTDLYTVRGVGSGSRDVDTWHANGLYAEDRGLQVPMALDHVFWLQGSEGQVFTLWGLQSEVQYDLRQVYRRFSCRNHLFSNLSSVYEKQWVLEGNHTFGFSRFFKVEDTRINHSRPLSPFRTWGLPILRFVFQPKNRLDWLGNRNPIWYGKYYRKRYRSTSYVVSFTVHGMTRMYFWR